MPHHGRLTTAEIGDVFADEIATMGGTVTENFPDGERLFARSVLPRPREVLPDDWVQDGVALRATGGDVLIHPYIYRQTCSNGAICEVWRTGQVGRIDRLDRDQAAELIREAVRACSAKEGFMAFAEEMRSASRVRADLTVHLMPLLSRLPVGDEAARLFGDIMERFLEDADSSRFGLLNAVTSVARDMSDPEARWRLEEFGGAILSGRPLPPGSDESRAEGPGSSLSPPLSLARLRHERIG
jgi:hypothetical protein